MTAGRKFQKMTDDEAWELQLRAREVREAGDEDKADEMVKQIPMPPWLARVGKETMGIRFLLDAGFNLSEAVEAFGEDWLNEK